jgi:DeoR/GlpR family transcriptional regulator of sugar metabolism
VCLDDSTNVGAMGKYVADRHPSTVITHSLGLMGVIAQHPTIAMVGLGGQYYSETDSFLGTVVVDQVRRVAADLVFVSTTALKNGALFHPDAEAALTKKAIIEMAERKVLLADASKFEANGLYHVVDLDVFDDIVVGADLPAQHRAQLERLGLAIHIAPAL